MADTAHYSDEYGEEEHEAESPVGGGDPGSISEPSPSLVAPLTSLSVAPNGDNDSEDGSAHAGLDVQPQSSAVEAGNRRQERNARLLDESVSDGGEGVASSPSRSAAAAASPARRTTGRHLLDNAAWTYSIETMRVRALKIPIADSTALRELRVFAVIDKQARQSRGSIWKADAARSSRRPSLLSTGSSRSLASVSLTGHGKRRSSSSSPDGRYGVTAGSDRRSGLLEEAKWAQGDGALRWTLPTEKLRQLKAYSPRIKVFLYGVDVGGIGDGSSDVRSRRSPRRAAEAEAADILSLGWFFLDLRTPDLPARWLKLQNARYGGEIQIRSSLSPFAAPAQAPPSSISDKKKSTPSRSVGASNERGKEAALRPTEAAAVTPSRIKAVSPQPLPQEIITDDAGDFLQLGTRDGTDVFIVSVAISGARTLAPLVYRALATRGETEVTSATAAGFWLSYSLFDVVVQTDVFHNLDAAEFPPIRDSFRVRSCLEDLRAFIDASHGGLPVFLCTENQIIAGITVPLSDLLHGDLFAQEREQQMPPPGTIANVGERFLFPEREDASVSASVSIEYVGPATTVLGGEERGKPGREAVSSRSELVDTHDGGELEQTAATTPVPAPQAKPVATASVSVTHVRLSNALLSPLVGSENVTASLTLAESHMAEPLQFRGFEKEYTIARLCRSRVVGTIDVFDRSSSSVQVQFTTSESKRCLAEATLNLSEAINSDIDGEERIRSVPLRDETGRPAGECVVRLRIASAASRRGSTADMAETASPIEDEGDDDDIDTHGEQRRLFRLSLQVKAIRDVTTAGTYTIAFEHPFHEGIRAQSQPLAVPAKRETSVRDLAYCVSERLASLSELKQVMSGTVAIDLAPIGGRDGSEAGGVAAFSLSYLFYSEEHFCCPDAECRGSFPTDEDAAAHWREAHAAVESEHGERLAYVSTSIKSCSIYVPVVRVGKRQRNRSRPDPPQSGQRVGMVRIDAALEDFGPSKTSQLCSDVVPQHRSVPELRALQSEAIDSPPPRPCPGSFSETPRSATTRYSQPQEATTPAAIISDAAPPREPLPPAQPSELLADRIAEQEQEQARRLAQQAREWKQQLAEAERARMDELEHEWARREEERAELLRAAQREYERLELKLRDALAGVEARERRLSVAEAALEREQRAHRDEMDALRKKLASEQSHAVSLATQQREALAQRVTQLESQLADAEQRAREVERDYAEYRRQQRKVPEARLREEIAALRGNIAELERQKLAEERVKHEAIDAATCLRVQLEQANSQVREERKKHETHVVEELEKLRLKYIAREEKYVLDGDREELRAIKRQLDELRGIHERTGAAATKSDSGDSWGFEANAEVAAGRPMRRRKRSSAKAERATQQQQPHSRGPHRIAQRRRESEDDGDWIDYHDDERDGVVPSPSPRSRARDGDQRSQRSSELSSDWDTTLDQDGGRREARLRRHDSSHLRRGTRISSSVSSSGSDGSFDAPGASAGVELEAEELAYREFASNRRNSPSRSENDAPSHQRHVFSSTAVASVASAVMNIAGSGSGTGSMEQELKRLQRERELLLASGTYNSKSYLVRELDRLIATTRGKMRL